MVQPEAGLEPLITAIDGAKETIEILIFRFDRKDIEQALVRAVDRGVVVQALIAWTNRGGERHLRRLETRLLAAGVTVSRTASDLARYHAKMMIVDRKKLYVLAFNFTALDINRSRSFGLIIRKAALVKEAGKLFEADTNRQRYAPDLDSFVVSPLNARQELAKFLEGAKKQVLIYDPCVSDPQMVRILEERSRAGVEVRILGCLKRASSILCGCNLSTLRLHTRTILRDGESVFVGSQSLRAAELDARREVGVILTSKPLVRKMSETFESDWKDARQNADDPAHDETQSLKLARKVAKVITKELPPVGEVIAAISGDSGLKKANLTRVDMNALEDTVREAVKTVVVETLQEATDKTAA
jgi:phosphatidylserine/phosphatidylglycerophosphate/cardiolipin synthase-like enzyme